MLGLGSQVKPHIERRFSMPWSQPAARMREFVLALRAIWASWHDGVPLDFRGEFYTHTLMTPFFSPPAHEFGRAACVPRRRRRAHDRGRRRGRRRLPRPPVHHPPYLARSRCPRSYGVGPARGPRRLDGFAIAGPASWRRARRRGDGRGGPGDKEQIAFYASTPAYRGVLEHHGWGDLQPELTRMSKEGKWVEMADADRRRVVPVVRCRRRPRVGGAGCR